MLNTLMRRHAWRRLLGCCRPGGVVLDFGSGAEFGLLAAERLGPEGRILSVGPHETCTVDWLMWRHELEHVDLLRIDHPGREMAILRGAERSLSNGQVWAVWCPDEAARHHLVVRNFESFGRLYLYRA